MIAVVTYIMINPLCTNDDMIYTRGLGKVCPNFVQNVYSLPSYQN